MRGDLCRSSSCYRKKEGCKSVALWGTYLDILGGMHSMNTFWTIPPIASTFRGWPGSRIGRVRCFCCILLVISVREHYAHSCCQIWELKWTTVDLHKGISHDCEIGYLSGRLYSWEHPEYLQWCSVGISDVWLTSMYVTISVPWHELTGPAALF